MSYGGRGRKSKACRHNEAVVKAEPQVRLKTEPGSREVAVFAKAKVPPGAKRRVKRRPSSTAVASGGNAAVAEAKAVRGSIPA